MIRHLLKTIGKLRAELAEARRMNLAYAMRISALEAKVKRDANR